MKRFLFPFLLFAVAIFTLGCDNTKRSWNLSRDAARMFHQGDHETLCQLYTPTMLELLPPEVMERVIRQTADAVGEPVGQCKWHYTYRITEFDPFRSFAIYKCPYQRESVKVTVAVEIEDAGPKISGLWADSPTLRKTPMLLRVVLCRGINENGHVFDSPLEMADWAEPRLYVWTEWQGLKSGDKVLFDWLGPDGTEVTYFNYDVPTDVERVWKVWSWIEPSQLEVAAPSGKWTVKIFLNDKEREAFKFDVISSAPSPDALNSPD